MEVQCDPLDDPAPGNGIGAECKGAPTAATATSHPAKRRKTRRVRPPFLFCTAPSSPVSPLSQRTAALLSPGAPLPVLLVLAKGPAARFV